MAEFNSTTDIGNRALQHVGNEMITSFADGNARAEAVSFVYGKLRQAELQRNVWSFAIRRACLRPINTNTTNGTDTLLLVPALWVGSTTYFVGSLVADENGTIWQSNIPNNLGNQPQVSTTWSEYFGPMTVHAWDSTTTYHPGELVYTAAGDGTNRVYLSLIDGNADNPATATAWSATATYYKNEVVTFNLITYMSLIDLNINQEPDLAPALWSSGTTYALNAKVGGSDGTIYQSKANGNLGHDPTLDVTHTFWTNTGVLNPWTTVFVSGSGSVNWRQIGGKEFPSGVTVSPLNIVYPLGSGPSSQSSTRNVFRLPAGFLRQAPTDPKAGSTSYLGASWGLAYTDWNFEGNYITSAQTDPIMLRFVADTVDVPTFHPMFCEGLGARIGREICEPLTQSAAKQAEIDRKYQQVMGEARTVNAIETGSDEPPVDDWIAARN
jgi:hypothetical protein